MPTCWIEGNRTEPIAVMKKIDYRAVDGQLLTTFLYVLEECSVTKAAHRLDVTQSTVSHALARLRDFFDDPLFVRSGNTLVPTERAVALKDPVLEALDHLQGLTHQRSFDPYNEDLFFIVAANDMQRDLIFPRLIRELDEQNIPVSFELIPSGHPTTTMMRDARCHLALTPFPPDASDIIQKTVFEGSMMCFYDAEMREAPQTWEEYCGAEHITVRFPDGGTSQRALTGVDKSKIRRARVSVPNFAAIQEFVRGTKLIATEMDLMKLSSLKGLEMASLPFVSDPLKVFLSWHRRTDTEPSHIWLRGHVERIASEIQTDFRSAKR